MKPSTLRRLCSKGLRAAPSQELGAIRIVPLMRDEVREDLRLGLRVYDEDHTAVRVGGSAKSSDWYYSYVPHGLIVGWSSDGGAAVARETRVEKRSKMSFDDFSMGIAKKMVRRTGSRTLRMLPLHVAMEGFLALHFRGPNMQWEEYSMQALTRGLTPRVETSVAGQDILGLEDALRVFEIHEGQCGMLLYVADVLASATVVGHPEDYGALHGALVKDFFGDLIWQHGCRFSRVQDLGFAGGVPEAKSLDDLRKHVAHMREDRAEIYEWMSSGLFEREIEGETLYKMGPFKLERFVTDLKLDEENHIGECVRREDGTLEYLKTFRLSSAQTRRAYLLKVLSAHEWNLDRAAETLKTTKRSLILRIDGAGFGALFQPHVLEKARREE